MIPTYLACVHRAAAADEVDHADGLVGAAEDGRVSTVAAGGVPHAAVALYVFVISFEPKKNRTCVNFNLSNYTGVNSTRYVLSFGILFLN